MPVLESTDNITPRSALRYRPLGGETPQGKSPRSSKQSADTTAATPVPPRASRARPKPADSDEADIREWQRVDPEAEVEEKNTPVPRSIARKARASNGAVTRATTAGSAPATSRRVHPLLYLGIGMLVTLALWTALTFVVNWWGTTMDDIHYGRPRTFQTDAFVGHNESGTPSHFLALNYNGRIEIIEFPGGDASHARIYLGPQLFGPGDDLVPVTLSFADVFGNHHPAMIVHFQSSRIVFINDAGGFRPATSTERDAVEHYLNAHGQ